MKLVGKKVENTAIFDGFPHCFLFEQNAKLVDALDAKLEDARRRRHICQGLIQGKGK